ncbi:MAG: hypothetical protein GY821_10285 [Gammaproteobacteria bacterium]|nr:hypothetical protein [Gammaproteobacteria bacterium]
MKSLVPWPFRQTGRLKICAYCGLRAPAFGFPWPAADDIYQLNACLTDHYHKSNQFIPIHVDAASGGFIAPFAFPDLLWDFRLDHVYAINVSSHKYGLVYPSLGWLLIRKCELSDILSHTNHYLGVDIHRSAIQFSHSAAHLVTQYYLFQKFEKTGYREIIMNLFELCTLLKQGLEEMNSITPIFTQDHQCLPGIVFTMKSKEEINYLADHLKKRGWYLPTYALSDQQDAVTVARIMIRYGFNKQLIHEILLNIKNCLRIMS